LLIGQQTGRPRQAGQEKEAPLYQAIRDETAWSRTSFPSAAAFTRNLTASQLDELAQCCMAIEKSGKDLDATSLEDFALPSWQGLLEQTRGDLKDGKGFVLIRQLPVSSWGKPRTRLAVWGLGLHLGTHVSQTVDGQYICDVMDATKGEASPRQFKTNRELSLHTDPVSDMIGLACLSPAKQGGVTVLASATTIYNTLRERAPELLDELFRGFHVHRFGEGRPEDGEATRYRVPMLSLIDGKLDCRYVRSTIVAGHKSLEQPLSQQQLAALDLFDDIASDPANHVSLTLAEGDIMLVNNLCVLHARTGFEEHDDPARHRHLLRLWLKGRPGFRPVPREMNYFNDGECGIPVRPGQSASYDITQLSRADGLGSASLGATVAARIEELR
jgi:alpha-ketoglutarate-dependent taurine dioxygenase